MGRDKSPNGGDDEGATFLHGELDFWIIEAQRLPNMDLNSERMRRLFSMCRTCESSSRKKPKAIKASSIIKSSASKASGRHSLNTSDPYVSVCLSGATVAQTRVISNCENPVWDEHFIVPVAHPVEKIEFHVKDNDVLGAELIGVVEIAVEEVVTGDEVNGWFTIVGRSGTDRNPELHVILQFRPVEENPLYQHGVGAGPDYMGVPNTYFPLRKGGDITLYQDAHVPDSLLPEIPLDDGKSFKPGQCWEDICHAIVEANHLIYLVGWSIYHPIKLVREPTKPLPEEGQLSLGELLKYKSQEGVRVILLIWDDKTSHDRLLLKTEGVMQTHDEETRKFFKRTGVHCVLAPRYASSKLSFFKQQVVGTLFTHHQKCVLLDTPDPGKNRKITAFIGGLDLCDGRYDTPEHRIFTDLDTVFKGDIHNPTFPNNAYGPRQAWHDLHCRVEGPAAHDILTNFEQRWRKASKWRDFKVRKVSPWQEDALIKLDRVPWITNPSPGYDGDKDVRVRDEEDPENWHVQVFRSIDSGSVKGFPKDVKQAAAQNLICGKNLKVDMSIHIAYIKAIRSAQHFIYIENQYFIGSSYSWPSYKNAGADNLVPMELALKIASKIRAKERFAVYIVIPMWPEGEPSSNAVQEMLFFQGQTVRMMYSIIAKELDQAGLSDQYHPQEYLNFYCLGKREAPPSDSLAKLNHHKDNRELGLAQKFRRFMIYVHAKGMIVDDEFVIMGSANINQRSLEGSRDTEIAMGAYQPNYTWARKKFHPSGQVYGYRMSLWAEHLGELDDTFREPKSLECVELVNRIAQSNWKAYADDDYTEMRGHLMQYPYEIGRDGTVSPVPGHETFPDAGGKILGAPTNLPDVLTT
ncbi:ARABIDOPSIS THALIANA PHOSPHOLIPASE D DELTA, phospholipase D delta [Hibiscus trionum]|uniref:Phospholipase D n=1 Tax=Hibiscus trionum TaxID=183268 RepID=A0A9W7LXQ0_HIBTR|nr:ARABIDOPSIS THALIANA PHOSPHOLIPASE D DELTA, phospholipase D delta [Hibiscus trionum]